MGILGAAVGFSFLIGIPVGGILATNIGNRAPTAVSAAVSLLNFLLTLLFFSDSKAPAKTSTQSKKPASIKQTFQNVSAIMADSALRKLMLVRVMHEIGAGIGYATWNEMLRSTFALDSQTRGFLGMSLGIVATVTQTFLSKFIEVFGGPTKTLNFCKQQWWFD